MSVALETAKEHLNIWLEAEKAIATGQEYSINGRSVTRADLGEVRKSIKYWELKVDKLERKATGKGGARVIRAVPRDL